MNGKTLEYSKQVATGFQSPASDYIQPRIDLNSELLKHPLSTFIFRTEGYSMINAFIPPKAKLIVDKSIRPENGDIVVVALNGEFTVRRIMINQHKTILRPENKKYEDILITAEMEVVVWGKVIQILIDPNELP